VKPNTLNLAALVPAATLWFFNAQPGSAQAPPSGLAGEIIQARQKNDALVRQFSWECRTDVLLDGVSKDLRIEQVNYGPGGQLQRTLVNDQGAPLPFGFLAARIAEEARAQVQQALVGLRGLLDQYTLPSSGKIVGFISQATISVPDANGLLQLTGSSVVVPGDLLSLWVNARTRQPWRMRIMTYYQGYEVTATATFNTLASGLNYMAYAQVNAPATGITVQVQNFDYINQNF
jgi:hypothetical protein